MPSHSPNANGKTHLQTIFDAINVALLLVDEEGVVKRVNNTLSRWVGHDLAADAAMQPGDFVGCIHAVADPAGCGHTAHCAACPIRNTFQGAIQTGQPVHDVEVEARLATGEGEGEVHLWLAVSADPLLLDGKRHAVLALNNITERKRYEAQLHEATEELRRSNQELEQFAYIASHDLQEPLRQVRGFSQLLVDRCRGQLDAKAEQYLDFIMDGAARMSDLIRDLLAYSRVGARRRREAASCEEALRTALANLQAAIAESDARVTHDDLPTLVVEPTHLVQLFQNLIGNAIKFRRPGVAPAVHVGACREGEQWRFSVRDNGIGIAPEHLDRVFLIFQRLHTREKYAGTGIGLAICKKIVEQYGGRIGVESAVDQGTTFHFSLPQENVA
jgi:signal transduction histidine kinase